MKINILTLFPQMFEGFINESIIGNAQEQGLVEFNIIDFRQYTKNKHKKVDDYPYSGGGGMLLSVQPLDDAIISNNLQNTHVIFPSPIGKVFNQKRAIELSEIEEITFVAGRYEGVDERFIEMHVDEQICLGDFILTGGELAIQVIIDSTLRNIKGVLGNDNSAFMDSFSNGLLEHPQYTRPSEYKGLKVPEVLINGNHKLIEEFKNFNQIKRTFDIRPDLLDGFNFNSEQQKIYNKLKEENAKV